MAKADFWLKRCRKDKLIAGVKEFASLLAFLGKATPKIVSNFHIMFLKPVYRTLQK